MSGQHRRHSTDRPDRPRGRLRSALPAAVGIAVAATLVSAAVVSLRLTGSDSTDTARPTAGVTDDRTADRAERGEERAEPTPSVTPSGTPSATPSVTPSATPSRTPTPKATTKSPTPSRAQVPNTAEVALSGTCGTSYYDTGAVTANGERFEPDGLTAAHKTWAFNTRVRVTNTANGKSVTVRINDRGPFVDGRCLDLARGAFVTIASIGAGVINARYEVLK